ncbi:MAG: hypothetical protein AB7Y46_15055 [Armatimonadota bacterium]
MFKLTIAAIVAALTAAAGTAVAQEYANIVVANTVVARIRTGGDFGSIYAREARISQRIVDALSNELAEIFSRQHDGPNIRVYQSNGRWTLAVGNTVLIEVYPADAQGGDTRALAMQWKENFRRQLPRAVAPSKVPQWWKDAHPEAVAGPASFQSHGLPEEDVPLVREVVAIFDAVRAMPPEQFSAVEENAQRLLIERIRSYRNPICGPPPTSIHIRAKSALKRVRAVDEDKYAAEKYMVAGQTITVLRSAYQVPAGTGPIPEPRPLPDLTAALTPSPVEPALPTPALAQDAGVPAAALPAGTPIREVLLGSGLDADNQVLNAGQVFGADVAQLLVYLRLEGAAPNTILGLTIHRGEHAISRRLLRVSGDRRLGVTFYPAHGEGFTPGDYECRLTINGHDAGTIAFRVTPPAASMVPE